MKALRIAKNLCSGLRSRLVYEFGVLKPRWLWIELTSLCNSRCEFCVIWKKKPTPNQLLPLELYPILSDPLFSNVGYLLNSGGEPTLRKDLIALLIAEHEALPEATIQLSTNGLLPDRVIEAAKEMQSLNVDFEVGISLDGVGEEHDRIRGVTGNFEKVESLIESLCLMRTKVTLGATLTEKNLEANIHAKNYSDQLGVPFIFHWFNRSSFYGNMTMENAGQNIEHAVSMLPNNLYRKIWLDSLKGKSPNFKCFALNTFAILKCNGDIAPCLSMWDDVVGNVRYKSPTAVWHSQEADSTRKAIRRCGGCLNSWACHWSISSLYYPNLVYRITKYIGGDCKTCLS